jgi:hypothetical protein
MDRYAVRDASKDGDSEITHPPSECVTLLDTTSAVDKNAFSFTGSMQTPFELQRTATPMLLLLLLRLEVWTQVTEANLARMPSKCALHADPMTHSMTLMLAVVHVTVGSSA